MSENLNTHLTTASHEGTDGIRRRVLTRKDLEAYTLTQLGFPVVQVEIESSQMGVLLEKALDVYNRYLPLRKYDVLSSASSGQNRYNFLDIKKPFGRGIVDVRIVAKEQFFSPISGVFALGIPHPISHLSPDHMDLALRYIGMAQKIYSSEPEWVWEEPVLWLYAPTGFGGPFAAAYSYTQDCAVPEDIPQEDHNWFKDYFYNLCKRAIGEARAKFGGIPGPAGQTLRGQAMIDEAMNDIKELEAEAMQRSYSRTVPLFLGSR